MLVTKLRFAGRLIVASFLVATLTLPVYAVDLTWTGASSSLIYDNGNATGNWNPSVPTGDQATGENWIFPDAATLGAGSTTPSFDSGGIFTVGGIGLGGLTFQTGAPTYTFTQTDIANGFNLAGSTDTTASTDRGIITNDSTNKQTFDMDVISARGTIDAKAGDIYFNAGHTFTAGGTVSLTSTTANNNNTNTLTTIFQGDHNIYLNSAVVQSTAGGSAGSTSGVNQNMRGALVYRGASTTPENAGALILGDIGTYTGKIVVDTTNGGVVRATHHNSFGDGTYISSGRRDTYIGNRSGATGDTSNGVVEIDGTAGNLTLQENFRGETRTLANGARHIRNVAGNNTIAGYVFAIINGGVSTGADAFIIESAAGTLKFTGGLGAQIANNTVNTYLQGNGNGEVSFGGAGALTGLSDELVTTTQNVTKRGNGTWTNLTGTPNTYRGTTTISGGKYIMNGTHSLEANSPTTNPYNLTGPIGDYAVQTGGTLGGTGIIGSFNTPINVNVQDGTLAPGTSAGTLTINGNVGFLDTSLLSYELTNNVFTVGGGVNDLTSVGGNLTLDGTLNVSVLAGSQLAAVGSYRLFDYTGTLTDNGLGLGSIALGSGLSASINTSVLGQVNLVVTSSSGTPGDHNLDGKVNAADYVLWRNDPATYGGPGGYTAWRANFGNPPGSGSGLDGSGNVPEPTAVTLVLLALLFGRILPIQGAASAPRGPYSESN